MWRIHFSQLLNVHGINNVGQTAELPVPEPSASEVKMVIEKLKRHASSGNDQIPAELIKAGDRTIRPEIHTLIHSTWNKEGIA